MGAYILKRILLMIPTLLGIMLMTFAVIQFVPGGPVEQYLAEQSKALGAPITIKGFTRLALGEGVEKKTDDFAAEVASLTGQA